METRYRTAPDAMLVVDLFRKTTQKTPNQALERSQRRLRQYDQERSGG